MGVDVIWEGERGPIDEIGDRDGYLSSALATVIAKREFPTLSRIDLYGRTQITSTDGLVRELTALRDQENDVATREHLSRVLSLARKAAVEPATILNFVGD